MEYFNSENVIVADGRLSVSGTDYALKNVKAAYVEENSIKKTNWKKLFKIWIGLIAFIALVLAIIVFVLKDEPTTTSTLGELIQTASGMLLICSIGAIIPLLVFKPSNETKTGEYDLFLSMDHGIQKALSSKNHSWISELENVLRTAITDSKNQ